METNHGLPCTHSLSRPQHVFTQQACQSACLHVKTHPWGQQQYSYLADEETGSDPLSNLPKVTQHVRNQGQLGGGLPPKGLAVLEAGVGGGGTFGNLCILQGSASEEPKKVRLEGFLLTSGLGCQQISE